MLEPGIYVASVTPFNEQDQVDPAGVARLLAWFEHAGCKGAVMAGTNGEGPSLSAVEKRDLVRAAVPLAGNLQVIAGVASASLEEAVWLCKQSTKAGAVAALVMAPGYFREATPAGIEQWFKSLLERVDLPVIAYNFPQRTGITLDAELLTKIADHERMMGVKDSSSRPENLTEYAQALPGRKLFVGDESLLLDALNAGWTGAISGGANVLAMGLSGFMNDYLAGNREFAETKFKLLKPVLLAMRKSRQPSVNKALLHRLGILQSPRPRLPLLPASTSEIEPLLPLLEGFIPPIPDRS